MPGKVSALINETKTWVMSWWMAAHAARTTLLLWVAYAAAMIGAFHLITNNNAWLGEGWLAVALVLLISRWLLIHDQQIANLTGALTAEALFRTAVVAHQTRMEQEIGALRAQLDNHIRSTSAPVRLPPARPRPTPYKR
jgi:hypothetical protein